MFISYAALDTMSCHCTGDRPTGEKSQAKTGTGWSAGFKSAGSSVNTVIG